MVCIMNLTKQDRPFICPIAPAKLGLNDKLQAENLCYPEKVTCVDGKIRLEKLPSFQYRVIRLR